MRLIAAFNRFRLARTKYWLPYEMEVHDLLLGDDRIRALHDLLRDQITHLYTAYRSPKLDELGATYSYQGASFWDYHEEFKLCDIQSDNAKGIVSFGGGMLAGIRLKPNALVNNPKSFSLENPGLTNVNVPGVESPPESEGWIKELELRTCLAGFF